MPTPQRDSAGRCFNNIRNRVYTFRALDCSQIFGAVIFTWHKNVAHDSTMSVWVSVLLVTHPQVTSSTMLRIVCIGASKDHHVMMTAKTIKC